MDFLLLRCVAPMQSWGDSSIFNYRKTRGFPTKSGIVGLIAAALGIERNNTQALQESGILDINVDVRIDAHGTVNNDYQIVRHSGKNNKISRKDYIFDGKFLVAVSHKDAAVLDTIEDAVKNPKNLLFFGRKSCPPAEPIYHSRQTSDNVMELFDTVPLLSSDDKSASYEVVITNPNGEIELTDNPLSFNPRDRKFLSRRVRMQHVHKENPDDMETPSLASDLDPMEVTE